MGEVHHTGLRGTVYDLRGDEREAKGVGPILSRLFGGPLPVLRRPFPSHSPTQSLACIAFLFLSCCVFQHSLLAGGEDAVYGCTIWLAWGLVPPQVYSFKSLSSWSSWGVSGRLQLEMQVRVGGWVGKAAFRDAKEVRRRRVSSTRRASDASTVSGMQPPWKRDVAALPASHFHNKLGR